MTDSKTGYNDRVQAEKPGTETGYTPLDGAKIHETQPGQSRSHIDEKVVPFTLTPDEISALAAQNDKPDADMTTADWLLWYMLRDVYRDFKQGLISKDTGAKRKRAALDIWERQTDRFHADRDLINRVVQLWKTVENAASAYRLNRTLENADKVMTAIYGIPCGSDGGEHSIDPTAHAEDFQSGGEPSAD